jgi:hypothetical protein
MWQRRAGRSGRVVVTVGVVEATAALAAVEATVALAAEN